MTVLSLLRRPILGVGTGPVAIVRLLALQVRPGPLRVVTGGPTKVLAVPLSRNFGTTTFRLSSTDQTSRFNITPSRWSWNKYKDDLHFYFMLGILPILTFVFLVNVFVGPAKLAPIPEGYVPKHWEYYKHPISRWFARYFFTSPQEDYERNIFYINEEEEKKRMRFLAWRVEDLMAYRGDYPNYFVNTTLSNSYLRSSVDEIDFIFRNKGYQDHTIDIKRDPYTDK